MSKYGELIASDSVRFERVLPGPIDRVWSFLVDAENRRRWLCGGQTDLREGGKVEMHFHNASLSNETDIPRPEKYKDMPEKVDFSGTVKEFNPHRLLVHTWDFEGDYSELTYELFEDGDKVKLVLTHRRLNSREEMISVCGGWHTHLDILEDVLAERETTGFWKQHTANEIEYEKRLPQ